MPAASTTRIARQSRTDYRGDRALVFASRHLEFVVPTGIGPRVTALRSRRGAGRNVFFEMPEPEARFHGYLIRGGHRLWHAPEDIVRSYQPDDEPPTAEKLANGIALLQATEVLTGLRKGMRIEFANARTVRVTHTLTNCGAWPIACAPWPVTMLRGGGFGVLPLLPKGNHAAGDLLPAWSLVPWTFTDLSQPIWRFHRDFIGIDVAGTRTSQKLGITDYPGWTACWLDGTTFVKYAPAVPGADYPDRGSCLEVFSNGRIIEIEALGPLAQLAPAATTTHIEHWTLLEGLPRPDTDAAFADTLAPAVQEWIAQIPGIDAPNRKARSR